MSNVDMAVCLGQKNTNFSFYCFFGPDGLRHSHQASENSTLNTWCPWKHIGRGATLNSA